MRVDGCEVQFAGDEEDDRPDGGHASEAARAALGGLEQAVDGLEESVGLTGLRPGHDAFQVISHEHGNDLHGFDLGSHDAGAPVLEAVAQDIDLLALQDLAQLFLVDPGPCGAAELWVDGSSCAGRHQPRGWG